MPEPAPPTRGEEGYATGRATKQAIIERAAEAFAQKGFYGASLRGIAREAGVDHSTLIHHFGNRTNLLLAVMTWHDEQLIPMEAPDELSAEFVVELVVDAARQNLESPGLVRLLSMMMAEAGAEEHPAREFLQKRHDLLTGLLALAFRMFPPPTRPGEPDQDPEARAALIIATWEGLQVYDALHPGRIDVPTLLGDTVRQSFGLPAGSPADAESDANGANDRMDA